MEPSYIANPEYRNYVSNKEKTNGKGKISNTYVKGQEPKMTFFTYYDSVVKNSHLYPTDRTTFIKVYTPPKKPATSTLLNNIEKKYKNLPNKILPTWQ